MGADNCIVIIQSLSRLYAVSTIDDTTVKLADDGINPDTKPGKLPLVLALTVPSRRRRQSDSV